MLTAKEVQTILGVADDVVIAHGYSYDRETTYDVWFHAGELHRLGSRCWISAGDTHQHSPTFQPDYFTENIKRWYDSKINSRLLELFATFGVTLPTTSGGNYPTYPPIYLD